MILNNKKHNQMKKSNFAMCAVLIAFCVVFVSCKEDVVMPPQIYFYYDNVIKDNGDEVYARVGDEVTIEVQYAAPPVNLKQIFLRVESEDKRYSLSITESRDFSSSHHRITETFKFEDVGDVQITASVMDKQDRTDTFEMKVRVR